MDIFEMYIAGMSIPEIAESDDIQISKSTIRLRIKKAGLLRNRADGVSVKSTGYVDFTRGPNKGRSVHVVVMEARLGRPLYRDECVHHIDANRSNNNDNNLSLVTVSGHARLHRREEKIAKGK